MPRRDISAKITSSLIAAVLFVASQMLFQASGWEGGVCVDSLTEPRNDPIPVNAWTDYGFPLALLSRSIEDCSPVPVWEIRWFGLIVNVAVFSLAGYGLNRLLANRRRLQAADSDP